MEETDRIRLRHMIEAAQAVGAFIASRRRSDLDTDLMLLFALVRALEIIGEAASKVSEVTRASLPRIPWRPIIGMRNRVVHAYFDVDRDIVWKAATDEVPALLAMLTALPEVDGTPA